MKKMLLNPIQRKFWMDYLLKFPSAEYNDPNYTFIVRGDLSITDLKKAYQLITLEYFPMHSTVQVEDGKPYFCLDEDENKFPFIFWGEEEDTSDAAIKELITKYVYQPFDLQREYPCRFYVIQRGKDYFLFHMFHHLVMDGQTLQIFFHRLSVIYNELIRGEYRFVDQTGMMETFNASFEREYLRTKEENTNYWKNYLQDIPSFLSVPRFSFENSEKENKENISYAFDLGHDLYEKAKYFCKEQATTHFRLYANVWALTLSKVLNVNRLLLDHTLSMRSKNQEELLGVFINNLPLKYDFQDENCTFYDIVQFSNINRKEEKLHQYAFYGDFLPLGDTEKQRREMINVSINYPLELKSQTLELVGCLTKPFLHVDVNFSYDLILFIENNREFSCSILYKPDVSRHLVQSLSETFGMILQQVLDNVFIKLKDIQLLTESKQKQILDKEHEALHKIKVGHTFLNMFYQAVCAYPYKSAVEFQDEKLSYVQLNELSDWVASSLVKLNLRYQYIGLSTPKNIEMIIGILGILKSGNIYVPIDYDYPDDRINFIIDDCKLSAILISKDTFIDIDRVPVYLIEDLHSSLDTGSFLPDVFLSDDAYVIYTSGTTGEPKGIPIKHSMLGVTVETAVKVLGLNQNSRELQFANICFDASIMEIFPILTVGGTLVLPDKMLLKDPVSLLSFLKIKEITSIFMPPAFLGMLPHERIPQLSTIFVGGDSCSSDIIKYWSENRLFVNVYGPTENCVDATHAILHPDSYPNDIGTSVPGTTCYVLDKYLHLMPDYTIGELYIGGVKLTEGYLNRPELNAGKFIPNPFVSDDDKAKGVNLRLYKTGDLVMRRSDGHLIFIGRSDFQVKLNGYRIELGDIESKIFEFGNIVQNTVVIVYEQSGQKRLVAYVQTQAAEDFPINGLKDYLHKQLPKYMIPAVIIPLKEFPYNTSGKIDRKQLPKPVIQQEKREVDMPVTKTEQELAALWRTVLPEQLIGREDNFMSLGGDSMAVIQLSFRMQELFDVQVKASDIYQHPMLKDLAGFIDGLLALDETEEENALEVHPMDVVPLPPNQFSLWLECMKSDEMKDAYNLPCMFECPVTLRLEVFEEDLNRLVEVQDAFRIFFPVGKDGKPYLQVAEYIPFHVTVCEIPESELAENLNRDMKISFDLTRAPLFHCVLYKVGNRKYVCSLVMHHLISDGWSAQWIQAVLLKAVTGGQVDWNGLHGSYLAYAKDAHVLAQTKGYHNRLAYWNHYLSGVSELNLSQQSQGKSGEMAGGSYVCPIPPALSDKVSAFCRYHACTPFVFYCSVYLMLLARVSKQTEFTIGFPYLGRERSSYTQVVGYFVHTLPLRYRKEYSQLSFIRYVKELQNVVIASEENAVSLDKMIEIARSGATTDRDVRLINAMFALEEKVLFNDYLEWERSAFDLSWTILAEDDKAVSCEIEYKYAAFSAKGIAVLAGAYLTLLDAVVRQSDQVLTAYSLASDEHCQSQVRLNSLTENIDICPPPFLDCFASVVRANPVHTAIIYKGKEMTYQELDVQSERVMLFIRSSGIPLASGIAVSMKASIEYIVTLIGVLKAGCYYVPIDVDMPEERRKFILQDAACRMLFTEENYPCGEKINGADDAVGLPDCAYVIYTSGTTGQPKGVPIKKQSLAHLIKAEHVSFCLTENSRVLLFSSISFDASITEIFTTLSVGAVLVIASEEQKKDPVLLADLLDKQHISCATIPPALLPIIPQRDFPDLKTLIVGGESTPMLTLRHWREGRTLINAYGPTENTVDTTLCVVGDDFEYNDIGTPLPGVSCYVLDEYHHIVPDGMVGELYIGGVQLTEGYLNRPGLNQEKFIENPYVTPEDKAKGVNTRLYKSGDWVRRRPDGHLIFMGRVDNQVKLRGFRIELSEIETLLQQCEGVGHALVEVRKADAQDELVAFVQPDKQMRIDVASLQAALRGKLPAYMIPSKWAVVEEFPLTISGKIDHRRLPEPDVVVKREVVGADTEDEQTLLAIAEEVIGSKGIGVETDLLDEAGMTSMQVMEFIGKIITTTDWRITVSSVYKDRTIRKLLHDTEGKSYFWFEGYDERKPILVFITGFPAVSPFYDTLLQFFARSFSVFVFESYYDFFVGKDTVSLDALLQSYEEALEKVLGDKPIAMVTGYCTGAELAIALANNQRRKHPERLPYPVLNMEGIYLRQETDEIPDVITEASLRERVRITNDLYKGFPALDYAGPIVHVMAGKPSDMIYLEMGKETDETLLEEMRQIHEANRLAWRKHYPNAPYYELDCSHWTFFEEKSLDALREIIRKHWNV